MNTQIEQLRGKLIEANATGVCDRQTIINVAEANGLDVKVAYGLMNSSSRVKRGVYSIIGSRSKAAKTVSVVPAQSTPPSEPVPATAVQMSIGVSSAINDSVYVPDKDATFTAWGDFNRVRDIIKSGQFFPIYISGYSGNGKTIMVEQACAHLKREYIRVQISPETDEDDLIGGFRLINGETVFQKGPVVKAMEHGAVLLIDELDRSSNKIMCLQGVLEGKPIMLKKTGEMIIPKPGFTVVATANTKGRGSNDGRYTSSIIIDDAFLERFIVSIDHPHPSRAVETKILSRHMTKLDCLNEDVANKLTLWSEIIRKTFDEGGIEDFISTRRLCHIAKTYSVFNDVELAVELCINRFDTDTKAAFKDLFSKLGTAPIAAPVEPQDNEQQF